MATESARPEVMLLMGIPCPDLAGLAVEAGMRSVILDCEHGFPLGSEIHTLLLACRAAGGRCIVRLPPAAVDAVGWLTDLGIDGILLSAARSLGEVERVAQLATFPPRGLRSVNPFVAAAGVPGDLSHLHRTSDSLAIWAMGETGEFLEELEGVSEGSWRGIAHWNGIVIGPYDLAANLGRENSPADEPLRQAVVRYARWADRAGLSWGMFVRDPVTLARWRMAGVDPDNIVLGYDRDIWFQACMNRVGAAREG